jgi:fermentation-respiration switch protein FrsA (DUF1100 family)
VDVSAERHAVEVPGGRLSLVLHLPESSTPVPCVVACHGLGASKDSDKYLAVVTWNAPSDLHELETDGKHRDGRGIGVPFFLELATHQYESTPSCVPRHLVVHGEADAVVPIDHGTVLHSRAEAPCDLVVIAGGDHRLTEPEHRRQAVGVPRRWFQRFLTTESSS